MKRPDVAAIALPCAAVTTVPTGGCPAGGAATADAGVTVGTSGVESPTRGDDQRAARWSSPPGHADTGTGTDTTTG